MLVYTIFIIKKKGMKATVMKENAIKILCILTLIMCIFSACGQEKFTCALCGETVTQKPHEGTFFGEVVKICDDCYESFEKIHNLGD